MSYEIVKSATPLKDGTVMITAACNNCRPLSFNRYQYHGDLAGFIESCVEGNFKLRKSVRFTIREAVEKAERLMKKVQDAGLSWEDCFRYEIGDRNLILKFACRELYAPEVLGEIVQVGKIADTISEMINVGRKNLAEAKEEDIRLGKIRMSCASYSIFEGHTLLWEYEPSGKGPLLAPSDDYKGGILQTAPENIVWLGAEADDLYSYLSFTGLALTREECAEKFGAEKIDRVDAVIARALAAGLKLRATPYTDYKRN